MEKYGHLWDEGGPYYRVPLITHVETKFNAQYHLVLAAEHRARVRDGIRKYGQEAFSRGAVSILFFFV